MDLASVVAALASVGVRVSGSTPNNNIQEDSSRACPTGLAGPEPSGTHNDPGQHFQLHSHTTIHNRTQLRSPNHSHPHQPHQTAPRPRTSTPHPAASLSLTHKQASNQRQALNRGSNAMYHILASTRDGPGLDGQVDSYGQTSEDFRQWAPQVRANAPPAKAKASRAPSDAPGLWSQYATRHSDATLAGLVSSTLV